MDSYFWSLAMTTLGAIFLLAAGLLSLVGMVGRRRHEMMPRHLTLAGGLLLLACLNLIGSLVVLAVAGP